MSNLTNFIVDPASQVPGAIGMLLVYVIPPVFAYQGTHIVVLEAI